MTGNDFSQTKRHSETLKFRVKYVRTEYIPACYKVSLNSAYLKYYTIYHLEVSPMLFNKLSN